MDTFRKMSKKTMAFFLILAMLTLTCTTKHTVNAGNVYLNYSWYMITAGSSFDLKVMGTSKKVKWSSSNKKIASVNKKGKVTAKKAGKVTITAKVSRKKYKCKVTVKKNPNYQVKTFSGRALNVSELKLDINKAAYDMSGKSDAVYISNERGTFVLKLLNNKKKVKWKTSNSKVATVNGGKVTAVSKGKCKVTAIVGKKSYKCSVTITDLNDAQKIATQEDVYYILGRLNKDRVKRKAVPLKFKDELNQIATIRAKEISKKFSHQRPDGTTYKEVYEEIGFKPGRVTGENLAHTKEKVLYMSNFASNAYKALYRHKPHREEMLNPKYEYIGIGYCKVGISFDYWGAMYSESYWVQELYSK